MNLGLFSVLSLFATSFGGSCWANNRMQVFGTSAMASFLKPKAPSIFLYRQWVTPMREIHHTGRIQVDNSTVKGPTFPGF